MTRSIWSGYSSAVEHEGDTGVVKRDIHENLIESSIHEGGINGDNRVEPAEGHACG
jgi:hypothetical protein